MLSQYETVVVNLKLFFFIISDMVSYFQIPINKYKFLFRNNIALQLLNQCNNFFNSE